MINFELEGSRVVLAYQPEFSGSSWVYSELKTRGEVTVSRAFTFKKDDLFSGPEDSEDDEEAEPTFRFEFAEREDGYFRIPGRILGVPNPVLITERGIQLERKIFVAERGIGIFRRIAKVKQDDAEIVLGGPREGAIPVEVFRELLAKFPDTRELDRYASARVEAVVGEYFDGLKSARENYERYLSKRKSCVSDEPLQNGELLQAEIDKFTYLRDTIRAWLDSSSARSERDWQKMIVKLVLLIFPKYIAVLENVEVADSYSSPGRIRKRYVDICLVDASGNLDIIEIKKPFDNAILSRGLYRDNSLPARELSGSIMQSEKYLFHLSKWGAEGENSLSERYKNVLPKDVTIHVTSPKAIIVLGRDGLAGGGGGLSRSQKLDFEVIKRKYARMMDILTYDDLLRRLDNIIASLSRRKVASRGDGAPPFI